MAFDEDDRFSDFGNVSATPSTCAHCQYHTRKAIKELLAGDYIDSAVHICTKLNIVTQFHLYIPEEYKKCEELEKCPLFTPITKP